MTEDAVADSRAAGGLSAAQQSLLELRLRRAFGGTQGARTAAGSPAQPSPRRSPYLLEMRREGTLPPFFWVQPRIGSAACYMDIADQLEQHPFYGLQLPVYSQEDAQDDTPLGSIEEIAARYLKDILAIQPRGPYLLGSWCLGSFVAYEIAQQLRDRGLFVALLAVLDAGAPHPNYNVDLITRRHVASLAPEGASDPGLEADVDLAMLADYVKYVLELPIPTEQLRHLAKEARVAFVIERAREIDPMVSADELRRDWISYRINTFALDRYTPRPYIGRVVLFRASRQVFLSGPLEHIARHPSMGWDDLVPDGVEVQVIPGDHDLNHGESVRILGERLRECVARALGEAGHTTC